MALTHNRRTGEPYRDNLCLFRCLALQAGEGERSVEGAAKANFERYVAETSQPRKDFCEVDLDDLSSVEELFSVSVYVYSIDEHNQAVCIRRSIKQFPCMYVNLYENHFIPILLHGTSRAFNMMRGLRLTQRHFSGQLNIYQRQYPLPVTCLVTKMRFVL